MGLISWILNLFKEKPFIKFDQSAEPGSLCAPSKLSQSELSKPSKLSASELNEPSELVRSELGGNPWQ